MSGAEKESTFTSSGSSQYQKMNFDDVTVEHNCILSEVVILALFGTVINVDFHNFTLGKFIISLCAIVGVTYNIYLLVEILNIIKTIQAPRSKYYEVINQLEAYMQKKQFPMRLQNRLKFFYEKNFRKSYYREDKIFEILSEPLQREIIINTNQLFVEKVKLFRNVSRSLVTKIAGSCKCEKFLPNDLIVKAGSVADCMCFIASGTVCVSATNGRELWHLEDGDYFGEVALILRNNQRVANVTAIEFCEIFILDYAKFKKYVTTNETIMQNLTETADLRLKLMLLAEEEQRKSLSCWFALK
ncbi:CLUMA_CG021395, isoform A [Clunio marinus]|uniref:CLUMA_CG021395, isoform A n=1 Tax=Clunio marinus TaxID=568069 RepID=A0A1J1J7D3_9DIPT|nr:CLUMA_CG021395, isoform A [Clunio marinus]